jgi:hypothetical protein
MVSTVSGVGTLDYNCEDRVRARRGLIHQCGADGSILLSCLHDVVNLCVVKRVKTRVRVRVRVVNLMVNERVAFTFIFVVTHSTVAYFVFD